MQTSHDAERPSLQTIKKEKGNGEKSQMKTTSVSKQPIR